MKHLRIKTLCILIALHLCCLVSAINVQIGALGTVDQSTYNTPYKTHFEDSRSQYIITSNELIAAGGVAGPILSLSFYVQNANLFPLNGFTIKIGHTNQDTLTNVFLFNGGFTNCFSQTIPGTTAGWNTYNFSNPFIWNGTENIVLEICFDNTNFSFFSKVHIENKNYFANTYAYTNQSTGCIINAIGVTKKRPVMLLKMAPLQPNDVGITQIDNPFFPTCNLSNIPLAVTLENMGTDTLKTATIDYWINGVPQPSFNWTGVIPPYKILQGVVIATVSLNDYDSVSIISSMPNGVIDVYNLNDTASFVVKQGLSGTYTIGSLGDYVSLSAAVSDLNKRGVCSPVVFVVDNAVFNEQIVLKNVSGINSVNTVTFKGSGNISKLMYNSSGGVDNYVVKLDDAKYFIFDSLTIENTGVMYSCVVEMINGCSYNKFSDCTLINDTNVLSTSLLNAVINVPFSNKTTNKNVFKNNKIIGGSFGINIAGYLADSNRVEGNIFYKQYFIQASFSENKNLIVKDNVFSMNPTYSGLTMNLYLEFCNELKVEKNRIETSKNLGVHYGIYNLQDYLTNKTIIANNFVSLSCKNNNDIVRGIYINECGSQNLLNNNIYVKSSNNLSCGLHFTSCYSINTYNNNVAMGNLGYAININGNFNPNTHILKHNNYYAPYGIIGYFQNTSYPTLIAWKTNTGKDQNSISIDPLYKDSFDLHTCAIELIGSGKHLVDVLEDIDGQTRDQNKPYIGADVFMDVTNFLQGTYSKCTQDSITLAINTYPNEALTYLWSPGGETTPTIFSSHIGWHHLTITTACGLFVDSVEVTSLPLPVANFIAYPNFENVFFSNLSANSTSCQWDFGDGVSSTAFNPSHTYTNSGIYNVKLIACNNCGCDTLLNQVTVVVSGVDELSTESIIKITPNPNNGLFILQIGKEFISRVEIIDIQGNLIYKEDYSYNNNTAINIKLESAPGIYFVRAVTNEKIYFEKMVVQ